jgi:hypothetical protein
MLFWFGRRRNRKFCTTSLVHRAVRYFKIGTDAAPVKLMYCCTMRPGAVIPIASVRGITVNSHMDHRRMNFCIPKTKVGLSDRWRFSLHQTKCTSLTPYHQFKEQQIGSKTNTQQQRPNYASHAVRLEWSCTAHGTSSFWNKEQQKQKRSSNLKAGRVARSPKGNLH